MSYLVMHLAAILLLSTWLVGLSAPLLHQAGNSSFTTLEEGSFWLSDGGNYTFGLQAIDGGEDYLLSIWQSRDPNKTAIWWVASAPLKAGASFRFASTGSLELYSAPPQVALLWSSNTSSSYAMLQDTGNLVLLASNKVDMSWQSFDDSRDSLMLAGLDAFRVSNKPYLLQARQSPSSYAAGRFHLATAEDLSVYFYGVDYLGNEFVYLHGLMNTTGGFQISNYFGSQFTSSSLNEIERLTMDYDGNLRVYMWESNVSSWKAVWQMLDDKCMLGSPCGPFGICTETTENINGFNCSCPPGYHPRKNDDISQGCQASISFNASCETGHADDYTVTIVEVPYTDYLYYDIQSQVGMSIDECKALCLSQCTCMVASYKNNSRCYVKGNSTTGYLMNGYAKDTHTLLIKVTTKKVSSGVKQRRGQWVTGVGVAVGLAILIVAAGLSAWLLRQRRRGKGSTSSCISWRTLRKRHAAAAAEDGLVRFFRYEELLHATRNFSEKLGEGGFGVVFKGWVKLPQKSSTKFHIEQPESDITVNNTAREVPVAVKVLKLGGGDSAERQFKAEVRTLGKIHHVNLVSLLGYCSTKRGRAEEAAERMLVFEYMENGSLEKYLSRAPHEKLAWGMRYSIALGTARGIAYLHHECSPPILHCDIKPHNILLDATFTAKVADFGVARRFHVDSHIVMSGILGTRGYLAPEWLTAQERLTLRVDVFSFGKLLLELVRGFRAVDEGETSLLDWAIQCITSGVVLDGHELVHLQDQSGILQQEAEEKLRVLKVGMWCIQHNPAMRPPMSHIVRLIEGTLAMEDPPIPRISLDVILPSVYTSFPDGHQRSAVSACNHSYSVVTPR